MSIAHADLKNRCFSLRFPDSDDVPTASMCSLVGRDAGKRRREFAESTPTPLAPQNWAAQFGEPSAADGDQRR